MRRNHQDETPLTQQAITERLLALDHAQWFTPRESWESNRRRFERTGHYKSRTSPDGSYLPAEYVYTEPDPSLPIEYDTSYGQWDALRKDSEVDPSKCYIMPEYASGSDYSGCLVERSNHKALIDMMPNGYEDGREYIDYSGGHGTFALAIRFDAVTAELLEALESVEDYPLLDESLHSEMEIESQVESWETCYRSEFKTALGKALHDAFLESARSDQRDTETDNDYETRLDDAETFLADDCGDMTDETVDRLFNELCELANEYWSNEQGGDSYIDVDRVVSRGLERVQKPNSEWSAKSAAEIVALIRSGMGDRKYDLGIVPYVDPNQLTLPFADLTMEVA